MLARTVFQLYYTRLSTADCHADIYQCSTIIIMQIIEKQVCPYNCVVLQLYQCPIPSSQTKGNILRVWLYSSAQQVLLGLLSTFSVCCRRTRSSPMQGKSGMRNSNNANQTESFVTCRTSIVSLIFCGLLRAWLTYKVVPHAR